MKEILHILYSEFYKIHDTGAHPENERRMAAASRLREQLPPERVQWRNPRPATVEELALVHTQEHIQRVKKMAEKGGGMLDPDTVVSPQSYEVALLSAGALLQGIDLINQNQAKRVFVVSRPPGHHALPDRAMGFCLFSNIAIAARYAQDKYSVKKILILDWDVHHGNGTQEVFYEDDSVFFISTHQHPHYPGTGLAHEEGRGAGKGFTKNLPFPAHTRPESIVESVTKTLEDVAPKFQPQLILISAGFDGHRDDPLGDWLLLEEHFTQMTREAVRHAEKWCGGKVLSCLEGGYNIDSLSASCVAHSRAMMGED